MDIKAIGGFYSVEYGRIIEKGETASFEKKRGQELISLGLAVELEKAPASRKEKPAQNEEEAGKTSNEEAGKTSEEK